MIISGLGGLFVGLALAEKLGLPLIQAYLYPFTPTREFPGVLTPLPQWRLTAWANRLVAPPGAADDVAGDPPGR